MRVLSLFSGIGGLDLAAEWAGMETVAFCEIEPYPVEVLKRRWPDVPVYNDVRELNRERLEADGILPIDIITGGFPCQDVSQAGKRVGFHDQDGEVTRSGLWTEYARLIGEIKPRWVVAENVRGLLSIPAAGIVGGGFGIVLRDLADLGYRAGWCCYGACDVGAPHRRERVFVVAYRHEPRLEGRLGGELPERASQLTVRKSCALGKLWPTPHANCHTGAGAHGEGGENLQTTAGGQLNPDWVEVMMGFPIGWTDIDVNPKPWPGWPAMMRIDQHYYEPPRTTKGGKNRAKRLQALGNAVVPQQAYPIFRAIMEVEAK